MNILVYGAGVLGSLYGAKLKEAGNTVTVLDRYKRLYEIKTQGIVLEHVLNGHQTTTLVNTAEKLSTDDTYDLVLVVMRRNQVASILPVLSGNKQSPLFLFMVNNLVGYDEWIQALGRERIMIGFAGAGGTYEHGIIRSYIVPRILQPTTLGELDGSVTDRIKRVRQLFQEAGFPTDLCHNMLAWQKYHVAWISPLANAVYAVKGDSRKFVHQSELVRMSLQAIREGFNVLKQLGFPIMPAKLRMLEILPLAWLVFALQKLTLMNHFETLLVRPTLAAFDEMKMLSEEFQTLARSTGLRTPALDQLHAGLKQWEVKTYGN